MPYIRDFAVTEQTSTTTSVTPELPEHQSNDILVVFANKDSTPAMTETSGLYTSLNSGTSTGSWSGTWYRRAASDAETPPTFTFTTETANVVVVSVAGAHTSTNPTGTRAAADDTTIPYSQTASLTTPTANSLVLWGCGTDSVQGSTGWPTDMQCLYSGDAGANGFGVGWGFYPTSGTETSNAQFYANSADDVRVFTVAIPDDGNNTIVPAYVDRGSTGPTLIHPFGGTAIAVSGITTSLPTSVQLPALGKDFSQVWSFDGTSTYTDETVDMNDTGTADVTLTNAVGAILYLGYSAPFDSIVIDTGTAGTGSPTSVWEYWNGGSWATLTITPSTQNFTAAGLALTYWTPPSNWAATSINSISAYYVRRRQTANYTVVPILDQGWVNGRVLIFDTVTATADSGVNPYHSSFVITPVQNSTNHYGTEMVFGSAQDWDTGYILTTTRYATSRDLIDHGKYKFNKGSTITMLDTSNNYKSWIVGGKDAADDNPDNRRVIAIQPSQTTDTSWAGQGSFNSSIVDTIMCGGTSPLGAGGVQFSQLLLSGEIRLAGGKSSDPINFVEAMDAFVNGAGLFPVVQRIGSAATIWNPIQFGGGDPLHVSINLRTFQFPTRSVAADKTTQWHVDDNQVGVEFNPTIRTFTGNTYSKSFNANTSTYTNEGTDWNDADVGDVALPPIQDTTTGDAIYFGHTNPFGSLRLNIGTAAVRTGYTLTWQYYNGTWTALSGIIDGTNGFQTSGTTSVYWTIPTDWTSTTIDSQAAYWIRCLVTTLGSTTTNPLGTQGWIDGDTCNFTNSVFTGETPYYWRVNASASPGAIWDFSGTTVAGATITLRDVTTFTNIVFNNCTEIVLNGADLSGCTLQNQRSGANSGAVAFTSTSEGNGATTCTFTDNNDGDIGHSIRITATGTYTFDGHTFTGGGPAERNFNTGTGVDSGTDIVTTDAAHGYTDGDAIYYQDQGGAVSVGLTDGTLYYVNSQSSTTLSFHTTKANAIVDASRVNLTSSGSETHYLYSAKADVYNSSGGAVTINITNSTDIPTTRNSDGSSTNVILSVPIALTVLDEDNSPIQNVQVYIQKSATGKNWNYTSDSGNNAGDADFIANEAVDLDLPQTGWLHVWDESTNLKQNYRYSSWSGKTFTFPTQVTGSATSAGTSTVLNSTGIGSLNIQEGDTIRNTTDGSWAVVDELSTNSATTTELTGGSDNTWQNSDAFSVHRLAVTYTDNDDLVDIPIFNGQTDSNGQISTMYNYSAYSANLPVLIRFRSNQGTPKYIPYNTSGTITSSGFSGTVVLTQDTVAT